MAPENVIAAMFICTAACYVYVLMLKKKCSLRFWVLVINVLCNKLESKSESERLPSVRVSPFIFHFVANYFSCWREKV